MRLKTDVRKKTKSEDLRQTQGTGTLVSGINGDWNFDPNSNRSGVTEKKKVIGDRTLITGYIHPNNFNRLFLCHSHTKFLKFLV